MSHAVTFRDQEWSIPQPLYGGGLIFSESRKFSEGEQYYILDNYINLDLQGEDTVIYKFMQGTWRGWCPAGTLKTMAVVVEGEHGEEWWPFVTVELVFLGSKDKRVGRMGRVHCFKDGSASRRYNNWHFYRAPGQVLETGTPLNERGHPTLNQAGRNKYEQPPPHRTPEDWMKVVQIMRETNWCPFVSIV